MRNPYYAHYRNSETLSLGGVTLCVVHIGDCYIVTAAACSPKDNFNRKVGRSIALGRFNSQKAERWTFEGIPTADQLEEIAKVKWQRAWERCLALDDWDDPKKIVSSVMPRIVRRARRHRPTESLADA